MKLKLNVLYSEKFTVKIQNKFRHFISRYAYNDLYMIKLSNPWLNYCFFFLNDKRGVLLRAVENVIHADRIY